jgi:ribonuclease HII
MLAAYLHKNTIEAGVDEAGRGCLAGPVFAAAVILPSDFNFPLLNDSKKLKEKDRLICKEYIEQHALSYCVAQISNQEIDKINILQASFKAMHKALKGLKLKPQHILVDGNRFKPYPKIEHTCIIKGDGKMMSIAAASILAKTYRDEWMEKIHLQYPIFNWQQNKGYPTLAHRKAVLEHGFSPHHRQTFYVQVNTQLSIFEKST